MLRGSLHLQSCKQPKNNNPGKTGKLGTRSQERGRGCMEQLERSKGTSDWERCKRNCFGVG